MLFDKAKGSCRNGDPKEEGLSSLYKKHTTEEQPLVWTAPTSCLSTERWCRLSVLWIWTCLTRQEEVQRSAPSRGNTVLIPTVQWSRFPRTAGLGTVCLIFEEKVYSIYSFCITVYFQVVGIREAITNVNGLKIMGRFCLAEPKLFSSGR